MEICIHDNSCGGCIYQGMPYQEQLALKNKEVLKLLEDKNINYENYLEIEGSPNQLAYRNKMEYTFGNETKDGEMTLGMHKKGSFMSVITVDHCQLVDPDFNLVLRATLDFCNEKDYSFYHKKSHTGLLRNLIVRKGDRTGELLVNIVTTTQFDFDEAGYVEMLLKLPLKNKLVGILQTLDDKIADFVYCEKLNVLWGQDYYSEELMGLNFKVSAFSFFQTNIVAVERLYTEALSLIEGLEGKTVFDLYCGTGTITQTLALKAKKVIGVEIVEEAVAAARENATRNGLTNCEFIAGDVLAVLDGLTDTPEVIVLDPPRVGIHPKALDKIVKYGVKQIVYISCNPKSLADNLNFMQYYGYQIKSVKAYDNFPNTKHTECVVMMEKCDSDKK